MKAHSSAKPEHSRHHGSSDRGGHGHRQQATAALDSRPEMEQQQGLLSLMAGSQRLQRKCACGAPSAAGGSCAACEAKANGAGSQVLQKKLAIGATADPLEREADRIADQVMAGPAQSPLSSAPAQIQRFTGQVGGQMDTAPASVERVLASSGKPLEAGLRRDMELRFGHDFSKVRVHTDGPAHASASAIDAIAYTAGRHIVFADGHYAPDTPSGRHLLAHELTHTIQQGAAAGGLIQRTFQASKSNCVAARNNAPADVDTELAAMDVRASGIAGDAATALKVTPVDPTVRAALKARFGLPPVFPSGRSMNRLTGAGVANQDTAIAGEVSILARRLSLSKRLFSQPIFYRCVGPDGGSTIGGCTVNDATCGVAGTGFSCNGVGAIFMCPDFWNRFGSTDERALVLVHESLHIIFGDVHESVPQGSGGRYRNASCYESFISDITGVPVSDTCPP
jgi:hypothetical protein